MSLSAKTVESSSGVTSTGPLHHEGITKSDSECSSRPISTVESGTLDLRKVRDAVPWRLWAVAVIGLWERAAFWGGTAPWQNYMEHPPHYTSQETPGALGLGQSTATQIYCAFYIFYYTAPTFFAILADSRLGRYNTLIISVAFYSIGWTVMTMTSIPSNIDKGWGLPGLIISMVLISLGGGGFRAIMVPFIADQYTSTEPRIITLKTGEQVITDRQLTLQYIYNVYFWIGNVGSLSWFATVYIELHTGFTAAYGLTLGFMVLSMSMLILGRRWYVRVPHEGNILPEAVKVISCAVKSGFKMAHADPAWQLKHNNHSVPWTSQLVREITRGLQACRVLLAFIVFYVCFDQMQNNLISQAGQMRSSSTPNDLLAAMNQVGCIVFGPLIQEILYPALHRRRIYLSPIARITIGFAFVALGMLYATLVQLAIYSSASCGSPIPTLTCLLDDATQENHHTRPNVWIQTPLYILISIGEIFAMVTAMEYAYTASPQNMKVVVQAVSLLIAALGSVIAMTLTVAARDPWLIVFYSGLAGAMGVTTGAFWWVFRSGGEGVGEGEDEADVVGFEIGKDGKD